MPDKMRPTVEVAASRPGRRRFFATALAGGVAAATSPIWRSSSAQTASPAARVSIRIDAGQTRGALPAAWRYFGHDEPIPKAAFAFPATTGTTAGFKRGVEIHV